MRSLASIVLLSLLVFSVAFGASFGLHLGGIAANHFEESR